MVTIRHPGSLLQELDLDKAQFLALTTRAAQLERLKIEGSTIRPRLTGENIAPVFEKRSTRTRRAFEVAAHHQGAHVPHLGPEGSPIGREEPVPDTARALGPMSDGFDQPENRLHPVEAVLVAARAD
ncbi:hypothetical protein C7C46_05020 [Streptomyces tateyamensis]|uniref:Aspartate/ornithine carbamoyltransferase carbamoyl-P binding domain-containing protein n=2 Tax=Streptomyces tateyamensis TaxID=565073 RepID=A0A2V4PQZ9_9ACTN|nr:hypothetical protein C7C46_05020 [Streptomyces tateyamensis]